MNTEQATARTTGPRAVQGILGARAAQRDQQRTGVIARQLDQIAPGTVRVRTVPVTTDGRRRTWVILDSATGPVGADREQHVAAHGLITRMFPCADWTRPQSYDARTGLLTVDEPTAPAALGLDTAEAAQ
ncbi:hypothetical protein [Streptomyces sp. NPDC054962]